MRLTRCENKHYYDADKYAICPHCEQGVQAEKAAAFVPKIDKPGVGVAAQKKANNMSSHTGSIWEQNNEKKTVSITGELCEQPKKEDISPIQWLNDEDSSYDASPDTTPQDVEPVPPAAQSKTSLQSQVNAVASHSSPEDVKTMAFYDFADTEPVVGWLVCVKGEYFGESFNLKAGHNFIGRALNMDVPLAKDTSVSRHKHAVLTYDPQNRVFYIQPGESSGLTYLNDSLLLAHQHINAYEKIKIGNSELIFVPCCGEQFSWEDYVQ